MNNPTKSNPLVGNGLYSMRDLYPNMGGVSTSETLVPEESEQDALANTDNVAEKKSAASVWIWLAVLVGIFAVMHYGKGGN